MRFYQKKRTPVTSVIFNLRGDHIIPLLCEYCNIKERIGICSDSFFALMILPQSDYSQRVSRAGIHTPSAADAFHSIRRLRGIDIIGTHFFALAAVDAGCGIFFDLHRGDGIEAAVDRAQGAKIPAERTVEEERQHQNADQEQQLPAPQPAQSHPQTLIGRDQRDTAKECAGGADVGAEPGLSLTDGIQHHKGEKDAKNSKHHIL